MKNSLKYLMIAAIVLLSTTNYAQIKNAKTEVAKVYGSCGMCKGKIEKAGNLKKIAIVNWDKDSQMATLTFDATKTNKDEILKKIALAGYDSDSFFAPNETYENLPGCCQYDRVAQTPATEEMKMEASHSDHNPIENINKATAKIEISLGAVYDFYFGIKAALVKTDGNAASASSKELLASINEVKMEELEMDVHMVWMKVMSDLKADATKIADSKDTKIQRDYFDTLSENIYKLLKVSKQNTPVYYQHCPMANEGKGANWLSKESTINNPYYGSIMLTCGKTIETVK